MKSKSTKVGYRAMLAKSGQWVVRKGKFDPTRFDTYSKKTDAQLICDRNTRVTESYAADALQRDLKARLMAALSGLTPRELSACRDLALEPRAAFP